MSIFWGMTLFFILVTMAFVAIAFFLPEWVGITGKKARQIQKDHLEGAVDQSEAPDKPRTPPKQ